MKPPWSEPDAVDRMREISRLPRFSLGAGMLLIAATGIGLAATRHVIGTMLGGQTSLFELMSRPRWGWNAVEVIRRAQDLLAASLPVFGGWTLVLPFLQPRHPGGVRRNLLRRPGVTACLSAILGIGLGAVVMTGTALTGKLVEGRLRLSVVDWIQYYMLEQLLIYAGVAVAVVWTIQALSGRWKSSDDWTDRLGRFLGILWIAAGLLWATRPYLRLF
jgi:hypothetical protein